MTAPAKISTSNRFAPGQNVLQRGGLVARRNGLDDVQMVARIVRLDGDALLLRDLDDLCRDHDAQRLGILAAPHAPYGRSSTAAT